MYVCVSVSVCVCARVCVCVCRRERERFFILSLFHQLAGVEQPRALVKWQWEMSYSATGWMETGWTLTLWSIDAVGVGVHQRAHISSSLSSLWPIISTYSTFLTYQWHWMKGTVLFSTAKDWVCIIRLPAGLPLKNISLMLARHEDSLCVSQSFTCRWVWDSCGENLTRPPPSLPSMEVISPGASP